MKVYRPREEIRDHHHPNLEPGRGHRLQVSPVLPVSHLLDLHLLIEAFAGTNVFYRETMRSSKLLVGFIIGRAMPWQSLLHSTAAVRPDGIKTEFSYLHPLLSTPLHTLPHHTVSRVSIRAEQSNSLHFSVCGETVANITR